ncbi:MAG: radical SAM protein [Elusimicrobiota bacterium]
MDSIGNPPPLTQVARHGNAPVERLEFHLSSVCDQKCVFCSESERMKTYARHPISYDSVVKTLIRKRRDRCSHVTFTGGEPTLYPRFPDVLNAAKRLGYRTYITTDASRLANPNYAKQVLPFLDEICISIHADTAAVHDNLAESKGSFERVLAAFENIGRAKPMPYVLTNTVVTQLNINKITATIEFLTKFRIIRHCTISNLAPDGDALKNFLALAPRLSQIAALAKPLARISKENGVTVRFFGVPLCLLGSDWDLPNDLHWSPRVTVERGMVGEKIGLREIHSPNPGRMRFYAPKCASCHIREISCFGVFKTYYEHYGDGELVPVSRSPILCR